jgi:hypothetical protein
MSLAPRRMRAGATRWKMLRGHRPPTSDLSIFRTYRLRARWGILGQAHVTRAAIATLLEMVSARAETEEHQCGKDPCPPQSLSVMPRLELPPPRRGSSFHRSNAMG